ncbi:SAM-dependent methyltransferase [Amycolatopsis suaedae]|uniref:SAM-dependent methyltransferase n=1 Tax=Amycolatopsis suaedae TaxID=2510978 RepID=A0A4Q7JBP6_9PSEU|nr:SAM-dependent methyltransferase [Amycolatopsis suaedae]RZQ65260.1 hypothetical protein EWH70_05080 [Amycolatopsis suaedae]
MTTSASDDRAPVQIDFDQPSIARVFDALLGGHDHYEVDRAVLRQIMEFVPEAPAMALEARQWLIRTVRFLADRVGIDQFLDLGSGLPTAQNTHQVAQKNNAEATVVYVDHDPVVQAHARALLVENDFTHIAGADLTQVEETLSDPVIAKHLDLDRPIGLIMCAVIHHIPDLAMARKVVHAYTEAMAPGSYLVLAHQFDAADGSEWSEVARSLEQRFSGTGLDTVYRTREEIGSFFEGLELVEPGLSFLHEWWPDGPRTTPLEKLNFITLGGVARKP